MTDNDRDTLRRAVDIATSTPLAPIRVDRDEARRTASGAALAAMEYGCEASVATGDEVRVLVTPPTPAGEIDFDVTI
jgi:hypothetical protein